MVLHCTYFSFPLTEMPQTPCHFYHCHRITSTASYLIFMTFIYQYLCPILLQPSYIPASSFKDSLSRKDRRTIFKCRLELLFCKMLVLEQATQNLPRFHNDFSITQILREINFGELRSAKSAIFTHLEALNFECCEFWHVLKAENCKIENWCP